MTVVTIGGKKKECVVGITYLPITEEYQPRFDNDITLFLVNGKLCEFHKKVTGDCTISSVTTKDKPRLQAYQGSTTLVMLKAFYEIVGVERIEKIPMDFSTDKGFFVEPRGDLELTGELLEAVKAKIREYMETGFPAMKHNVNIDEMAELFTRYRMHDKARLFQHRKVSRVSIYSIGNFEDYFYGYVAQNTGYTRYFDSVRHEHGFVFMPPIRKGPKTIPHFDSTRKQKLFQVLEGSSEWGEKLGMANVDAPNEMISRGKANELILIWEALQEKKIGQTAGMTAEQRGKKLVMIVGPSSSGKITFSYQLSIQLRALGMNPHSTGVDDYFVNRVNSPRDADGNYDCEVLECLDIRQFNEDMTNLLNGKTVEVSRYNFIMGMREYKDDLLIMGEDDILVTEGIHCLNDRLPYILPKESKFKIYISALTQLNTDEHNRIPTMDSWPIRRTVRDARTRGASTQIIIRMWPSVRKGREDDILPFQEETDVIFNPASVYEPAVLKQYAEPILFQTPRDPEEYSEAKRLLKSLNYLLGVSSEDIP